MEYKTCYNINIHRGFIVEFFHFLRGRILLQRHVYGEVFSCSMDLDYGMNVSVMKLPDGKRQRMWVYRNIFFCSTERIIIEFNRILLFIIHYTPQENV